MLPGPLIRGRRYVTFWCFLYCRKLTTISLIGTKHPPCLGYCVSYVPPPPWHGWGARPTKAQTAACCTCDDVLLNCICAPLLVQQCATSLSFFIKCHLYESSMIQIQNTWHGRFSSLHHPTDYCCVCSQSVWWLVQLPLLLFINLSVRNMILWTTTTCCLLHGE